MFLPLTVFLVVLVEVLLAIVALIIIVIAGRELFNSWRRGNYLNNHCNSELIKINNLLVDYSNSPSTQKCQAINIKINAWNGTCGSGSGQTLPLLKCEES